MADVDRPVEDDWPHVRGDATCLKAIVPVAVTIAVGVNGDGRREEHVRTRCMARGSGS